MLGELTIRNFAIIEECEVSFKPGLNIVSGETGAGKSILVGAVNLILGGRASQELIRTDAQEASIEAVFAVPPGGDLARCLSEMEIEYSDAILIVRTINRKGRSRIFVNDQRITLQQLQLLTRSLVAVSGQHEHQSLLVADLHLAFLDSYGGLEERVNEVANLYDELSGAVRALEELKRAKKERTDRMDWMRFQLQELEAANLQSGEEETLERERNLLLHAATLHEASQMVFQNLYAGQDAVLAKLSEIEKGLETIWRIDAGQKDLATHLEEAKIHLEEVAHSIQQFSSRISHNPRRLEEIEERLALLHHLSKKYGRTVEELLARIEELRDAISRDEESDFLERELEKKIEKLEAKYLDKALLLSRKRDEVAKALASDIEKTLEALDMSRARFGVQFHRSYRDAPLDRTRFTPRGIDMLEFLLSANPGEELKPLNKVASGGELSRIMLALKSILSRKGAAETMIFDEVDAGIGGRTAELVGLQLKKLAEKQQVICITHLPQIACHAQHHFKVEKELSGQKTSTKIRMLSLEERVEELARMLGGVSVSEKTRAQAREFLERAHR